MLRQVVSVCFLLSPPPTTASERWNGTHANCREGTHGRVPAEAGHRQQKRHSCRSREHALTQPPADADGLTGIKYALAAEHFALRTPCYLPVLHQTGTSSCRQWSLSTWVSLARHGTETLFPCNQDATRTARPHLPPDIPLSLGHG